MSCENYKKRIYLFDELSEHEKRDVARHISTCRNCALVFEDFKATREWIKYIRPSYEISKGADFAMTNRIMNALREENKKQESIIDRILTFLCLMPVRYGLGALSLFLSGVFIAELQYNQAPQLSNTIASTQPRIVTLNASIFVEHAEQALKPESAIGKSTSFGLYNCIVACKKSEGSNCKNCLNDYSEKIKYYADL